MKNRKQKKMNMWKDENGSALILVMVILISGILIFSAITSISLLQRSASSKARSSTEALQIADSCLEWTLMKYYDADIAVDDIDDIGSITSNIFAPSNLPLGNFSVGSEDYDVESNCEVYLMDSAGDDIDDDTKGIDEIEKIRSVGRAGFGDDVTTRAVQVNLGP